MLTGAVIKAKEVIFPFGKMENRKRKKKRNPEKKKILKRGEQHFTGEYTRVERESKCWELRKVGRETGEATKLKT